jgi:hypothetical protein
MAATFETSRISYGIRSIQAEVKALGIAKGGWASVPGIRKVPKPGRGMATPCVVNLYMLRSFNFNRGLCW